MRLGRNIARAFLEYYKFMGIIPQNVYTGLPGSGDNKGKGRKGIAQAADRGGGVSGLGMSVRREPPVGSSGDGETSTARKRFSIGANRNKSEDKPGSDGTENKWARDHVIVFLSVG